jgi:copper chaperone CopZ
MAALRPARKERDARRDLRLPFAQEHNLRILAGMNLKFSALVLSIALAPAALADVTVTLKDVHICCTSCVKAIDKATATVNGAAVVSDKDAETVTITAPDNATAQKAVDALVAAGYFGVSSDPAIKVDATTGASAGNVQTLAVNGVHLCCKTCVTDVNEALAKVPGVKATTAAKGAATFEVTGDGFNAQDVFTALHDAGFAGKAGKAP